MLDINKKDNVISFACIHHVLVSNACILHKNKTLCVQHYAMFLNRSGFDISAVLYLHFPSRMFIYLFINQFFTIFEASLVIVVVFNDILRHSEKFVQVYAHNENASILCSL